MIALMRSKNRPSRSAPGMRCEALLLGAMSLLIGRAEMQAAAQDRPDVVWMRGWYSSNPIVSLSPDGRYLAVSSNSTAKILRTSDGTLFATVDGGGGVAFSPDGRTLATAGYISLNLFDMQTYAVRRLDYPGTAMIAFSPDGSAVARPDALIQISDGAKLASLPFDNALPVSISPDGKTALGTIASQNLAINELVRISDGTVLHQLDGANGPVFSPDGQMVGSTYALWRVSDGALLHTLGNYVYPKNNIFTPDGSTLITGGGECNFWNTADGTLLGSVVQGENVNGLGVSGDGTALYTVGDSSIKQWALPGRTLVNTLTRPRGIGSAVAITPDRQTLVTAAGPNVALWRMADGAPIRTLTGQATDITGIALSSDGQTLLCGSYDNKVDVWKLTDGTLTATIPTGVQVTAIALSPDGLTFATGNNDGTVKLWRLSDGALLSTLSGHTGRVHSVVFSPNGQLLASGADDSTIRLWNPTTGALVRTLTGHTAAVNSVAFSPNGTQILSGSNDYTARLWNAATGAVQATFAHTYTVLTVAFAPDGRTFLTGDGYTQLRFWRLADRSFFKAYSQETQTGVTCAAYSPDGKQIAYGRRDGTLTVINAPVMRPAFDFDGDGHNDLAFQNSQTGQIALWHMNNASVQGGDLLNTVPNAGWTAVGLSDFNQDASPDLVFQNQNTGQIAFWFMNGSQYSEGWSLPSQPAATYKVVGIGDFNGDGKPDLVFQDTVTGRIAIWFIDRSSFTGQPIVTDGVAIPYLPATNYRVVGVADFNSDGSPDLLFQNSVTGQLVTWYMNGATFIGGAALTAAPLSGWQVRGVADYNNDDMPDIVFQNATTNQVVIWNMNGLNLTGGSLTSFLPATNYQIIGPH